MWGSLSPGDAIEFLSAVTNLDIDVIHDAASFNRRPHDHLAFHLFAVIGLERFLNIVLGDLNLTAAQLG